MPPLNTQMPQQSPPDPLAQLKDIQLPDAVSAWPPAPGWWILAAVILMLAIWVCLIAVKRKKQNRYRQHALHEIQQLSNPETTLTDINALLKRVALVAYPDQPVAALNGDQWVNFLYRSCPQLGGNTFMLLAQGPYQNPSNISVADIEALKSHCITWIKKHRAIQSQSSMPSQTPAQSATPAAETA